MRLFISLIAFAIIIVGAAQMWRSGLPMPGIALILIGLSMNTILAVSRFARIHRN